MVPFYTFFNNNLVISQTITTISFYFKQVQPDQPIGLASQLEQLKSEFGVKMEEIKTQTSKSFKDQNEKIAKVMSWEHKLAQLLNQSIEVNRTKNRE